MNKITAVDLKRLLSTHQEFALIDIREHGQYGESHLFFAVSIPFSALEYRFKELAPRVKTPIVIYANAQQEALLHQAVVHLNTMGYEDVRVLDGGIEAWQAAGFNTFAGVNLPSKTFGELAEHAYKTPHLSAHALHDLLNDPEANVLVLDGRPVTEYKKMNIPGAACCPNGELALRAAQMVKDDNTTIVINCAGRTRSIIGAQSLINFGIKNPVYALENGTQGWYLEDYALEHGSNRLYPSQIDEPLTQQLQVKGKALIERFELANLTVNEFNTMLTEESDTTFYLCDVRTKEEFDASKWPAIVRHTPGGQLIQATDEFIGVKNATLVLLDTDGIRAPLVASWLKQLGWKVYLLAPQSADDLSLLKADYWALNQASYSTELRHCTTLTATALDDFISSQPELLVFDTRNSIDFRKQHLSTSHWLNRAHLPAQNKLAKTLLQAPKETPILLMGDKPFINELLAQDLEGLGFKTLYLAVVTSDFFDNTKLLIKSDETVLDDDDCIDYLFFVHDRHHGNKAAAIQYLKWETDLISQVDEQEKSYFNFSYVG